MRELRGQQDFPLEPVAPEVGASGGRQQLDRHPAPELHVGSEVHGRHAAAPQLAHQAVATREGAGQAVEEGVARRRQSYCLAQQALPPQPPH